MREYEKNLREGINYIVKFLGYQNGGSNFEQLYDIKKQARINLPKRGKYEKKLYFDFYICPLTDHYRM